MPITWNSGTRTIDFSMTAGWIGHVLIRFEGNFVQTVSITDLGGTATIPMFANCNPVGLPPGVHNVGQNLYHVVPGLIPSTFRVQVKAEQAPVPGTGNHQILDPFGDMIVPSHASVMELRAFTFRIIPGEDVHITIVMENGAGGNGETGGEDDKHGQGHDEHGQGHGHGHENHQ